MSNIESISLIMSLNTEAEVFINYKINPPRVEECHGFHEFSEDEEMSRELLSFKILLESGEEIDILNVLTPEMKDKILDCV